MGAGETAKAEIDLEGELVNELLTQKIENKAGPKMRRHLVKVLKQRRDEKSDLASTVKQLLQPWMMKVWTTRLTMKRMQE